jgi:hypothetical protein
MCIGECKRIRCSQDLTKDAKLNTTVISDVLNKLVDPKTYDKRLRPKYGREPVEVGITIHVSSISAVSEVDMVSLCVCVCVCVCVARVFCALLSASAAGRRRRVGKPSILSTMMRGAAKSNADVSRR